MKSPWNYLARITSLGRAAKTPEREPETTTDNPHTPPNALADAPSAESLAGKPKAEPTVSASNELADDLDAEITDNVVVPVSQPVEPHTISLDLSEDHDASLPDRAGSTQPVRSTRQPRTRQKSVKNVAASGDVASEDRSSAAQSPPATFFEEVTALDDEIMQLRRQLAVKLRLQNAQLTKMLERYDA